MRLIACTLVLALAAPAAALAGPAGSGLAHTEWVAKKHAAARAAAKAEPLRLKAPTTDCLPQAEAALTADPAVRSVARWGEVFMVQVRDPKTRTASADTLQRVVDTACGASASAS